MKYETEEEKLVPDCYATARDTKKREIRTNNQWQEEMEESDGLGTFWTMIAVLAAASLVVSLIILFTLI